ncbi:MAG: hypothetical protein ACK4F7_11435 [Inhella sp.]
MRIREVAPCGDEALGRLRLAAAEMRALYAELQQPGAAESDDRQRPAIGSSPSRNASGWRFTW